MLRRATFLVLLALTLWMLLPACSSLPIFPPTQPSSHRETEESLYQEAEEAYRQQAYRRAWQDYMAYLERYPKGQHAAAARLRNAELLGLLGDWQGSLSHYQALLAQAPEPDIALKARYGVGRAYFKLGQYQQASRVLDSLTATEIPPSLRFSTNALLAEIALKQDQIAKAFARLRLAAQDLSAGDKEWLEDLKTRLVKQATPADLEHLATLYRDDPLSAALLLRLAQIYKEGGQMGEAQKWERTLKERFPESKEAAAGEALLTGQKRILGCLLPLSGEFSAYGQRVKDGMELAAQEAKVELIFKDCPNDPQAAARLVREMAQDQNILALLGPLTSGAAQGAAQAAQETGVPLIALSQRADLTQTGNFVFQAFLTARHQMRSLVRYTLSAGMSRYAILTPDSPAGRTFSQQFQDQLGVQGGSLALEESYLPGTTDFAPVLAPLATAYQPNPGLPPDFQGLLIPDDAATAAAIASQRASGPLRGVPLLGTNLVLPGPGQEKEARALEGILFPDAFFQGDPSPAVQKFSAAFRQKYGSEPDYLAAQGYAVVRGLGRLLKTEGFVSRAELPRRLLNFKNFPDLPWLKGFDANRQAEMALYILTIRDGRVQLARPPSGQASQ